MELGYDMAELQMPPLLGRGPPSGSPTAPFGDSLRRFDIFGGSNDVGNLPNKDHRVRIEDTFATVQELRRSDLGASRKAPKTKRHKIKRLLLRRIGSLMKSPPL